MDGPGRVGKTHTAGAGGVTAERLGGVLTGGMGAAQRPRQGSISHDPGLEGGGAQRALGL